MISLHLRLTPYTRHIINREALARCRQGVLLVNTARGALVETDALAEALASGQVGGAGLDVLEHEQVLRRPASSIISAQIVEHLRGEGHATEEDAHDRLRLLEQIMKSDAMLARTNVVFTPHVAFNSVEAIERLYAGTIGNIRGFPQRRADQSRGAGSHAADALSAPSPCFPGAHPANVTFSMRRKIRKSVGLLGLGIIGSRVATGLRAAGFQVYVWNRTPRPAPNFLASPAEVAEVCDIIQLFVADGAALMEVLVKIAPKLTPEHIVICERDGGAGGDDRCGAVRGGKGRALSRCALYRAAGWRPSGVSSSIMWAATKPPFCGRGRCWRRAARRWCASEKPGTRR